MTPIEFKAWFDGFTEALTDVPTKAQWARIKERVAEIDGKPVPSEIPTIRLQRVEDYTSALQNAGWLNASTHTAMNALGRAEATSLDS